LIVVTIEAEKPKEDEFEALTLPQAMKFFYAILNKYGGKNRSVTMSDKEFDNMPAGWADKMKFRRNVKTGQVQACLGPNKRKRKKVIQPKKKLILPPSCRRN
jgi:hypothetical protein